MLREEVLHLSFVGVLRPQITAGEAENVLEGAVGEDLDLLGDRSALLRDKPPAVGLRGRGEQVGEGGFGRPFVRRFVVGEALERGEVVADRRELGFDLRRHAGKYSRRRTERNRFRSFRAGSVSDATFRHP